MEINIAGRAIGRKYLPFIIAEMSGNHNQLLDRALVVVEAAAKAGVAEVIETNERAISFYKKTGFSEEGRLKEFVFKDGRWLDVIVMGIIGECRK
jgi:sialic acid synthase SpsE